MKTLPHSWRTASLPDGTIEVQSADGRPVCVLAYYPDYQHSCSRGESEANARLVAAAPDLLRLAFATQKAAAELLALMPSGMSPEMRAWKDRVRDIWCATIEPLHNATPVNRALAESDAGSYDLGHKSLGGDPH